MKTLVAEDDFTSRRIVQRCLSFYGPCDIVTNGEEALEAVRLSWKEMEPYDLICLDIHMPGMDGQQVLAEIRRHEKEKGTQEYEATKVIMITVAAESDTVVPTLLLGVSAYLLKPISCAKIMRWVRSMGVLS